MAAREDLLAALRRAAPAKEAPLPDLSQLGVTFDDLPAQLAVAIEAVGGICVRVPNRAAAKRALVELPVHRDEAGTGLCCKSG